MDAIVANLKNQRDLMIQYLDLRRELMDWRGVQDAASGIREIEAQLKILRQEVTP